MKNNPKTTPTAIPFASPYYDRLRSLNIQMDFVPYGSPEWHHLERQIQELERRARQRMTMDGATGVR